MSHDFRKFTATVFAVLFISISFAVKSVWARVASKESLRVFTSGGKRISSVFEGLPRSAYGTFLSDNVPRYCAIEPGSESAQAEQCYGHYIVFEPRYCTSDCQVEFAFAGGEDYDQGYSTYWEGDQCPCYTDTSCIWSS